MTRSPLPEAAAEVAALRRRIAESAPRRGWRPPDDAAVRFATLPLSARTLAGLAAGGFETLKPIQRAAIPHALADRDVLGAARTGSGKTLAFLVPAVEALYRERWAREDGLGALVVSPTRELALQIFGVLRVVGARHDFSAGLITGGRATGRRSRRASSARASSWRRPAARSSTSRRRPPDAAPAGLPPTRPTAWSTSASRRSSTRSRRTCRPRASGGRAFRRRSRRRRRRRAALAARALADAATVEFVAARDDRAAPARRRRGGGGGDRRADAGRAAQRLVVCALEDKLDLLYAFVRAHVASRRSCS